MAFFDETNDASTFVVSFTEDPEEDFGVFATGYTLAANRLAGLLLSAPRFSDYEAYPVVFLYKHAFELSLKHVIYSSVRLARFRFSDDVDEGLRNTHDLTKLSRAAVVLLGGLFPNDLTLQHISAAVAEIAADWSQLDPRSEGYRYPVDTKGQRSTRKHQEVNLRAMAARMSSILEDLDTIHFGLNVEIDRAQEAYLAVEQLIVSISNPEGR